MTQPDVALGLLSALCQFGSFGASLFIGADELFLRRERLRRAAALQRATARGSLALHFLLEHPDVPPPAYMWRCKPANVIQSVRDEAARSNDIVFLNTSRDYVRHNEKQLHPRIFETSKATSSNPLCVVRT